MKHKRVSSADSSISNRPWEPVEVTLMRTKLNLDFDIVDKLEEQTPTSPHGDNCECDFHK